jgi:hypothetical protein
VTVAPGGQDIIPACGPGWEFPSNDLTSPAVTFPDAQGVNAVAFASGTGLVALGTSDMSGPDIYVYQPGRTTPANAYDFGYSTTSPEDLLAGGGALALSADGSKLYAVTVTTPGTGNPSYTLHVLDSPAQPKTSVTLSGPATAYAGPITLTGTMTFANGPAAKYLRVSVSRTGPDGTVALPQATIGAGGTFTVPDSPTAPGSYTYTASYLGPRGTTIATASDTVAVTPNTTALTLSGPSSVKSSVTLSGALTFNGTPAPAGTPLMVTRTVEPTLNPNSGTPLPTVTTGSGGTFTITDKPGFGGQFLYTVTYAGNASHGYASAGVTVGVAR